MRKLQFSILIHLCFNQVSFGGCSMGKFCLSNLSNGYPYKLEINDRTNYQMHAKGNQTFSFGIWSDYQCHFNLGDVFVLYNTDTVFASRGAGNAVSGKIPEKVGHYKLIYTIASVGTSVLVINFEVTPPQTHVDTSKVKIIVIPSEIAATPTQTLNPIMQFYPMPANAQLTVVNETEQIKSVSFYSIEGKKILFVEPYSSKAEIPLEDLPAGIYLVKVATVSNKVTIKKIEKL